jgi:hypothetical protein
MKIRHLCLLLPIILAIMIVWITPGLTAANLNGHDNSGAHIPDSPRATSTWARTYGGSGNDSANSIVKTNDGGYIVAGSTNSFGAGSNDALVIKIDAVGAVKWQKANGSGGFDGAAQVITTTDGGYALVGCIVDCFGHPNNNVWVFKLDASGSVIWDKSIGGSSGDNASSIVETSDSGYIVAGFSYSFNSGCYCAWVFKLDSSGNFVWQKYFTGESGDQFLRIIATPDDNFLLIGQTYLSTSHTYAGWIMKIDGAGSVVWQNRYGGSNLDGLSMAVPTGDGGYVVAGTSWSFGLGNTDGWVFKIDGSGNVIWQRVIGGSGFDGLGPIVRSPAGGYVLAGTTTSFGAGGNDAWVLKIDDGGNIVWQKTYGGSGDDGASDVVNADDGGYVVVGSTSSFGDGGSDMWILKLDSEGNIGNIGGCGLVADSAANVISPTFTVLTTTYAITNSNATSGNSGATVNQTTAQVKSQCALFNNYLPAVVKGITSTVQTCDVGQCQSNPVPFGQSYITNDLSIKVTAYERPSNRLSAPPGYDPIAMELSATCLLPQASRCYVAPNNFEATGLSGIIYNEYLGTQGSLPSAYFFGGNTVSGWVGFIVPNGETGVLLIYYAPPAQVFFAVQ